MVSSNENSSLLRLQGSAQESRFVVVFVVVVVVCYHWETKKN